MSQTKLNIFEIANNNVDSIEGQLTTILNGCECETKRIINQFMEWLNDNGRVSINPHISILAHFIKDGAYYNIYEWARDEV